jgi:hypothetical protein
LGREPFPLMQSQAVAKLAMEASRRQYLHEPRRRPQSTFIVVRHLHFPGNRGFGVRNELCSHIDYSLCSFEPHVWCIIEVSMVGLLYVFHLVWAASTIGLVRLDPLRATLETLAGPATPHPRHLAAQPEVQNPEP